jgi:multidrug transporter EmrE-like cation transporter
MQRRFAIWSMLGLIAVLLVCWSAFAQEKVHFDKVGRVNFTIKSAAAGVGYSWGEGHFIFKDKTYPIKVSGLSVVTAGLSSTNVVGDVYNLKDPSDIAGKYTVYKAGAAAGVGMARATAKNPNGVSIDMVAESKGVKFDLGAGDFTIQLK